MNTLSNDAQDKPKVTLKNTRKVTPLPDAPRYLSREERRAAMRAQKKKLRKTPMKEKSWEDISAQCADIFTQINDTKTEVIAQVNSSVLDDEENPEAITAMRAKAKDLGECLDVFATELTTLSAKINGRTGKLLNEQAVAEYDDLQEELMDYQFRYMQTVIPKATDVALDATDYIAALEEKRAKKKEQ